MTHGDIALAYQEGRSLYRSWSKAPTQTTGSGIWFDLSMSPGNPIPQYYVGGALAATQLKRSTDGGLDHGADKPGFNKMLHKFDVQTVLATAAPLTLELLDYLLFYPFIGMDVGPQELTNVNTLPRYTDGRGVQIMAVEQSPYVGSADFFLTYTNSDGVAGRVTPTVRCNTQAVNGTVATSASAQVGASRFVPLMSGDAGVRSIESIEFTSSDVGLLALALVVPLATFQIAEVTAPAYYDLQLMFGYMPIIQDDAYLNLICLPTGTIAAAQITGSLTTIWSA